MSIENAWSDGNFKIRQGSREPGSFRVGKGGGAAVLTFKIADDKLEELMTNGIESAAAHSSGRIRRILPIAHPRFSHLFLSDLDSVTGTSFDEKVEADPYAALEVPCLPYYAKYAIYEAQGRFESRPYPLIPDNSIPIETVNYYDTAGNPQSTTVPCEWWRYCTWTPSPAADWLTAEKGQWLFSIPTPFSNGPQDRASWPGAIRELMSTVVWTLTWHFVPYSYILSTNSYLTRFVGMINQQAWEGFNPGAIQLQAVQLVDVFSPPFPEMVSYAGVNAVSQEKLCTVNLIFLEVFRTAASPVTPVNPSHIANYHNTAIHGIDGRAYYFEANRSGSPGTGRPLYDSVPFQLIFKNPDAP